jgi:hypothetical protein
MVQFRRLDPLANASVYQRLLKSPVKSFTLTEAQFNRVQERRPQLIVTEGERAVVSVPYRDRLEVHYAFPEVADFRDHFGRLFDRSVGASSKEEAPRGLVISFRDRPNRALAQTVFWSLILDEGKEWVEMNLVSVPEQAEPADSIAEGYTVRAATTDDFDAVADLEAETSGEPRLTSNGIASVFEHARWLRLIVGPDGSPAGFMAAHTEPGGWTVIDALELKAGVEDRLREPVLRWTVAFLRNNGGRRQRRRVFLDQAADLTVLRNLGFTPGETGIDYTRAVDPNEVKAKIEERQAHGTLIRYGDWR